MPARRLEAARLPLCCHSQCFDGLEPERRKSVRWERTCMVNSHEASRNDNNRGRGRALRTPTAKLGCSNSGRHEGLMALHHQEKTQVLAAGATRRTEGGRRRMSYVPHSVCGEINEAPWAARAGVLVRGHAARRVLRVRLSCRSAT